MQARQKIAVISAVAGHAQFRVALSVLSITFFDSLEVSLWNLHSFRSDPIPHSLQSAGFTGTPRVHTQVPHRHAGEILAAHLTSL